MFGSRIFLATFACRRLPGNVNVSQSLARRPYRASAMVRSRPLFTTDEDDDDHYKDFSVGIFVDLDNVKPTEYTRATAKHLIEPLRQFAEQTLDGKVERFHGWGNKSTQSFAGRREEGALENVEYGAWDGNSAETGYDETGILRCAVCGGKIQLTKKDRSKGLSEEDKLKRHMKSLHAREQKKRLTKRKSGRKLPEKELERLKKFKSAAVGVMRQSKEVNDLFQVLKEKGMRCKVVNDVDKELQLAANVWMQDVVRRGREAALIVVSKDSDFAPTLKLARGKGLLAISASPDSKIQTKALVKVSDIVLEAREQDDHDDYANDFGESSLDAVYKVSALTEKGDEALRRGYVKKISDSIHIMES